MAVTNERESRADLGEVAEAGIHLPHPTQTHNGHDHEHEEHDHDHGFEVADILRVIFVALAAAAVWFHLWEPFHKISVIGLVATLIGGYPTFLIETVWIADVEPTSVVGKVTLRGLNCKDIEPVAGVRRIRKSGGAIASCGWNGAPIPGARAKREVVFNVGCSPDSREPSSCWSARDHWLAW
jgi:hypothetical protein